MILLVTGSRELNCYPRVRTLLDRIDAVRPITGIVHGDCQGADKMAETWALHRKVTGRPVDHRAYRAEWRYGRQMGPARNEWMLTDAKPDAVLALTSGGAGTEGCIALAMERGIPTLVVRSASPWLLERPSDEDIAAWLGVERRVA